MKSVLRARSAATRVLHGAEYRARARSATPRARAVRSFRAIVARSLPDAPLRFPPHALGHSDAVRDQPGRVLRDVAHPRPGERSPAARGRPSSPAIRARTTRSKSSERQQLPRPAPRSSTRTRRTCARARRRRCATSPTTTPSQRWRRISSSGWGAPRCLTCCPSSDKLAPRPPARAWRSRSRRSASECRSRPPTSSTIPTRRSSSGRASGRIARLDSHRAVHPSRRAPARPPLDRSARAGHLVQVDTYRAPRGGPRDGADRRPRGDPDPRRRRLARDGAAGRGPLRRRRRRAPARGERVERVVAGARERLRRVRRRRSRRRDCCSTRATLQVGARRGHRAAQGPARSDGEADRLEDARRRAPVTLLLTLLALDRQLRDRRPARGARRLDARLARST